MSGLPTLTFVRQADHSILLGLEGDWKLRNTLPKADVVITQIESEPKVDRLSFDTTRLGSWDSGLLIFLRKVIAFCSQRNISIAAEDLPQGAQRLLRLASSEHQRSGIVSARRREKLLVRVADAAIDFVSASKEMLDFTGETFLALCKLFTGKPAFRRSDFLTILEDAGARSLPIVSLISCLVGLILAFVASVQLRMFGAQIYVADVVGIGMVRVMGAIMTGIIMAGRTGASFAAQLGTMQVNEEIDALKTLGISPMEFLVMPRMLALVFMMPLLCLYADLMGVLGGMFVSVSMLDISIFEYWTQTKAALNLTHLSIGLFHSAVFGVLVAMSGCLRGMQCGRSASAVGYATTSAVVTGIVSIVVSTAIITFGCDVLGI